MTTLQDRAHRADRHLRPNYNGRVLCPGCSTLRAQAADVSRGAAHLNEAGNGIDT